MKQRAPLDWEHSSWDGVRVTRGLSDWSWMVVPDNRETELLLLQQCSESQKPAGQRQERDNIRTVRHYNSNITERYSAD